MLSASTVLVVEEEFLIALDIQRMLEHHDPIQTIFARSAAEALQQRPSWGNLGLAVVEVRGNSTEAIALCMLLAGNGVPVVVSTGDGHLRQGVPALPGLPVVVKPVMETDLASAITLALADRDA